MDSRLFIVFDRLRTSFWFIPFLMALGAVLLAVGALVVDRSAPSLLVNALLVRGEPAGVQRFLATLAASMVTVTGIVFSVTIVALSLAAQQFGPRLLRTFMRDRGTQFVLGTFIATFVYCIITLVNISEDPPSAPQMTTLAALLLTLLSIAVLIYFIHHIAVAIQAETVIRNVFDELRKGIEKQYRTEPAQGPAASASPPTQAGGVVAAPKDAYIQQVDDEGLLELADEEDIIIRVLRRPGKYMARGEPLFEVWPTDRATDLTARLHRLVAVGPRRTEGQDVEYLIDQLVEIAVRSLSKGINDPFTANECIDRLGSALRLLADRHHPPVARTQRGQVRLFLPASDYEGLVKAALDRPRQYGATSAGVLIRLLEAIGTAAAPTIAPGRRRVLRAHADRILRTAHAAGHDRDDLEDMEQRHAALLGHVSQPDAAAGVAAKR